MHRAAGITLLATALTACRTTVVRQAAESAMPLAPIFGPAVSTEVIGGKAEDDEGRVWLLAGGSAVVRIDLERREFERVPLDVPLGESCWGLARLADGSLWTLKGRRALAAIGQGGRIDREIMLGAPHFGLFASGERLLYQAAEFTPPAPALRAGLPGDEHPQPWSDVTTRPFVALARASAAALNMVSCGSTRTAERPCWFPDEAAVSLIQSSGATRRVPLAGLELVAPEVLLTSENPARPVRDAYLDERGVLWILSSGKPPIGGPERPGGWILARYSPGGALIGLQSLTEPVRLILRAGGGHATVLTGAGMIADVQP
jgi:hypothetical protein